MWALTSSICCPAPSSLHSYSPCQFALIFASFNVLCQYGFHFIARACVCVYVGDGEGVHVCRSWFSLVLRINYAYLWVSSPSASSSACPACSLLPLLSVLGEALISSGISTPPLGSGGGKGGTFMACQIASRMLRRTKEAVKGRDAMTWRAKSKNNCQVNCENC